MSALKKSTGHMSCQHFTMSNLNFVQIMCCSGYSKEDPSLIPGGSSVFLSSQVN